MVFTSLAELKKSDLYKRSDALKAMSARQLSRFLDVFAAVYARIVERGGDEENAESTAIAIALPTARRASASLDREMENELHFFAAMTPQQFGGDANGISGQLLDFAWILENPDLASLTVAGNEFNWNHERATTALGQIRGLVLRKDAPLAVRRKTHKDVPFLFVASYYNDVDEELKELDTISAEWVVLAENDGVSTPLPQSFAVARDPLNDPTSGILRVASWSPEKAELSSFLASMTGEEKSEALKSPRRASKEPRATMPPKTKSDTHEESDLAEMVASLQEQLKGHEKMEERIASLQKLASGLKGLEPLAEALASLGEKQKDPLVVLSTFEASLKQLADGKKTADEKIASLQVEIDGIKKERAAQKAGDFAASLLKEGKIKADQTEKWASLFLKDESTAAELAAGLTATNLGEASGKGAGPSDLKEQEAALLLGVIDSRFAKKKEGDA